MATDENAEPSPAPNPPPPPIRLMVVRRNGALIVVNCRPEWEDGTLRVDAEPLIAALKHRMDAGARDDGIVAVVPIKFAEGLIAE